LKVSWLIGRRLVTNRDSRRAYLEAYPGIAVRFKLGIEGAADQGMYPCPPVFFRNDVILLELRYRAC